MLVQDSEQGAADAPVGPRLRHLRQRLGFSQRELARRSGVTNATISQIEQGNSSPSVASLQKIVRALDMTLAQFFSPAGASTSPFLRAEDLVEMGSGGISLRLVGAGVPDRALQMLVETYPSGSDTGPGMLEHSGEECGVVVSGRIEVTVGDETRSLGPGDAYYFPSSVPHRFRNLGSEPCELISAATPASF